MKSSALGFLAGALGLVSEQQAKLKGHIPMTSGSIWARWARRASRMSQKELQVERAAINRARELGPKFARMTRQQRFHAAFAAACKHAKEKYGPEPRRARRKMARRITRRMLRPVTARETNGK